MIPVGSEPAPMYSTYEVERKARPPLNLSGKSKGRFALLNAFVDFSMGSLSRSEIIVWTILFRDSKDGIAATAQEDIARRGRINRRTVGRSLRRLESRGLLKIVHQGGFRRGVSRYRVCGLATNFRGT